MENMKITDRVAALRRAMQQHRLAAYIVPSTDPHASEYIADHWKERAWISGFTGSAGDVVVSLADAGLWTDSRYFLQADLQLRDSGIRLFKDGVPGTPTWTEWLCSTLREGDMVGINPEMISANNFDTLRTRLEAAGIELKGVDLIGGLWTDRPAMPMNPVFVLDEQYSGRSVTDKLAAVRSTMKSLKANVYVISALDEICWLLNIRGTDVDFNPVVVSYAVVEEEKCTFFIAPDKLTPEVITYLVRNHVAVTDYQNILPFLRSMDESSSVLYDGAKLNEALFEALPKVCRKQSAVSPVFKMKAVKNEVELAGVRRAMHTDGLALVRFFRWLEEAVQTGQLTEYDTMVKLKECRAQGKNFVGESFGTIAGYGPNGAIVHYEAEPATCATLRPTGMFLLDSGGQYFDGTTDITRTICFDTPTAEMRRDYTLVLRGHLALGHARFPEGTRGNQLDVLARQFLWNEGLSYGHGTGHGVGHFLCVHEGPQNIRTDNNPTPLEPGMIVSNEPGLYRAGQWGIRIENLVAVRELETTEFARFYGFETLTVFPYCQALIDWDMLSPKEVEWINEYHQMVYDNLAPDLTADEREWLAAQCRRH